MFEEWILRIVFRNFISNSYFEKCYDNKLLFGMTINPLFSQKYPKKTLFLEYGFFSIEIFTVLPTLKQLLTHQKLFSRLLLLKYAWK